VTLRKISRDEAERADRVEWRALTSPQKLSILWDLTVAWMDTHGIPAKQRRLQRTVVAIQRRRSWIPNSRRFAPAHYGRPRYTKNLDIWLDRSEENARRAFRALTKLGALGKPKLARAGYRRRRLHRQQTRERPAERLARYRSTARRLTLDGNLQTARNVKAARRLRLRTDEDLLLDGRY